MRSKLDVTKKSNKHRAQSTHYFENALHFMDVGDAEKASEFLWGSVSQALKAVAASRGIELKSHSRIRGYAMELAKSLQDESIRYAFNSAQQLHSNFYETGLLLEDVVMGADDVKKLVAKLFELIPGEDTTKERNSARTDRN